MCHSSTRPGTSLHVTQVYQAFPRVSIASDKRWGEKAWARGYLLSSYCISVRWLISGLSFCTYTREQRVCHTPFMVLCSSVYYRGANSVPYSSTLSPPIYKKKKNVTRCVADQQKAWKQGRDDSIKQFSTQSHATYVLCYHIKDMKSICLKISSISQMLSKGVSPVWPFEFIETHRGGKIIKIMKKEQASSEINLQQLEMGGWALPRKKRCMEKDKWICTLVGRFKDVEYL